VIRSSNTNKRTIEFKNINYYILLVIYELIYKLIEIL
jgi:hypothetical protein